MTHTDAVQLTRTAGSCGAPPTDPSRRFARAADGIQRLIGSSCEECGTTTFPAQQGCPRCTSPAVTATWLSPHGRLWTWTVQAFPPKSPPYASSADKHQPFGVAYVELADEVIVEGRLVDVDLDALTIGDAMQLVVWDFVCADSATLEAYGFTGAS